MEHAVKMSRGDHKAREQPRWDPSWKSAVSFKSPVNCTLDNELMDLKQVKAKAKAEKECKKARRWDVQSCEYRGCSQGSNRYDALKSLGGISMRETTVLSKAGVRGKTGNSTLLPALPSPNTRMVLKGPDATQMSEACLWRQQMVVKMSKSMVEEVKTCGKTQGCRLQ